MEKRIKEPLKKSVVAKITLTLTSEEIHDKIQKKAFELYKKRGRTKGSDWNDWFEAERIVMSGLKNS